MAEIRSRKKRGRETEKVAAARLREVFPHVEPIATSLPGRDLIHTPGYAIEVKSRRNLNLPDWLRQAGRNAGQDYPVVVSRPDGYGPERVDSWPVSMPLWVFIELVERARRNHVQHQPVEAAALDLQRSPLPGVPEEEGPIPHVI